MPSTPTAGTRLLDAWHRWVRTALIAGSLATLSTVMLMVVFAGKVTGPAHAVTQVRTQAGESALVTVGDADIRLGPDTELAIRRPAKDAFRIELARGRVDLQVEPRRGRPAYEVLADDVLVQVVGTGFSVQRDHSVHVAVEHGIVAVVQNGKRVALRAGESWQRDERELASADAVQKAARRNEKQALPDVPERAIDDTVEGAAKPETQTSASEHGSSQSASKASPRRRDQDDRPELMRILDAAKPLKPIYLDSYPDQLRAMESLSQRSPARAAKELESFGLKATGSEASFAFYARAYLLFFRLKDDAAVVAAANLYQRRFPKAREAEDMLWLRVRASCRSEEFSECRSAAHSYLRRYPNGVFHGLASRLTKYHQ